MLDIEKFVKEIIDNAKKQASAIVEEAKKEEVQFLSALEEDLSKIAENNSVMVEENASIMQMHKVASARIATPKVILEAKIKAVDSIYNKVKQHILDMSIKDYFAFLDKLIIKYATEGNKVIFAKKDIKNIPKDFIENIAKRQKIKLVISDKTHNGDGGIILQSSNYDQNLTLEAVISVIRLETETEVAKMLFS